MAENPTEFQLPRGVDSVSRDFVQNLSLVYSDSLIGPSTDNATSSSECLAGEREPPDRNALRQTREKLRRHGLTGLFHAVFAISLFAQGLVLH